MRKRSKRRAAGPSIRTLACYYEAGHAVVAVALRGAEAVDWSAVLPSRKLSGSLATNPRHKHGATKLAIAPIASPKDHPLQALEDAVIAVAGVRAQHRYSAETKVRASKHDVAIFDAVWTTFCDYTQRELLAFQHWMHVRADFQLLLHWSAVESIAKTLDEKNEVRGREIAAEVAAARISTGL